MFLRRKTTKISRTLILAQIKSKLYKKNLLADIIILAIILKIN